MLEIKLKIVSRGDSPGQKNCLLVPQTGKLKIALAPMAGITDSAFRLMNVLGGEDLTYSEMVHVNAISYKSKKTFEMLKASPFEFPYVVQLFGNDPDYFARATRIISEKGIPVMEYKVFSKKQREFIENLYKQFEYYHSQNLNVECRMSNGMTSIKNETQEKPFNVAFGKFYSRFQKFQKELEKKTPPILKPSGLDINLGCPAKKVFGHGSGARLFSDISKMKKIVEAVVSNTSLPVSVKLRTSVKDVSVFSVLDELLKFPLKRVMVHGRSYEQGFAGEADHEELKKVVKKYPEVEVYVNGGIVDQKSAFTMVEKTGCYNLGIARGSLGNPLLGGMIKSGEQNDFSEKTKIAIFGVLAYIHCILNQQSKGKKGLFEIRKHLAWYFKGFEGASEIRSRLVQIESVEELERIIDAIY